MNVSFLCLLLAYVEPLPPSPSALAPSTLTARAGEEELESFREYVALSLENLAAECQAARAFAERNRQFESLLIYSPDHAGARKALGYKRDRNGEWQRAKKQRAPKNYDEDALLALRERRAEWEEEARDRLLGVLKDRDDEGARRAVQRLLQVIPDDAELRSQLGEARAPDGRWLSKAAARSLNSRSQRRALIQDLFESAPTPSQWQIEPSGNDVGVAWKEARFTTRARVAGTVPAREVEQATRVVHVLQDYLRMTFNVKGPEPLRRGNLTARRDSPNQFRFTVYLCGDEASRDRLIANWPRLGATDRELFPKLKNGWLDKRNTLGVWSGNRAERLDNTCRQRIGAFLRDHFQLTTRSGWIWEGFGMYLTHELLGTRKTFFVRRTPYLRGGDKENLDLRLTQEGSDWLGLTIELLEEGSPAAALAHTLGRDVNAMTTQDLLLSYSFAAYLIEAHPEKARNALVRCGKLEAAPAVLESELGKQLPEIVEDWTTWLIEVTGTKR